MNLSVVVVDGSRLVRFGHVGKYFDRERIEAAGWNLAIGEHLIVIEWISDGPTENTMAVCQRGHSDARVTRSGLTRLFQVYEEERAVLQHRTAEIAAVL